MERDFIQLTGKQQDELLGLLWPSLKTDSEHKDRKHTSWGTKTTQGLVACIQRIINEPY